MIKENKKVKGFIAKVNIVDRKSGKIVARNQILECEHHDSVDALNRDLAKLGLPRKLEFIEWVA
jgi:endonuclease III